MLKTIVTRAFTYNIDNGFTKALANQVKSILKYRAGDIYEEVSFNRLSGGEEQYKKILSTFVSQKSELLKSLENEQFELRIRLRRRDEKNFWYVAIVTNEKTQCFLTDENGKIIAEKVTKNNA